MLRHLTANSTFNKASFSLDAKKAAAEYRQAMRLARFYDHDKCAGDAVDVAQLASDLGSLVQKHVVNSYSWLVAI